MLLFPRWIKAQEPEGTWPDARIRPLILIFHLEADHVMRHPYPAEAGFVRINAHDSGTGRHSPTEKQVLEYDASGAGPGIGKQYPPTTLLFSSCPVRLSSLS